MNKKSRTLGVSKVEKIKRIRLIQEDLINGILPAKIVEKYSGEWNLTERMINHYIKTAFDDFKKLSGQNIDSIRGFHLQARMSLLEFAMSKEKYKPFALDVLQDMAKLQGLYVHKHDITSDGEKLNLIQVFIPDNGRDDKTD